MRYEFLVSFRVFTFPADFIVDDDDDDGDVEISKNSGVCETHRRVPGFDSVPNGSTLLGILPCTDDPDSDEPLNLAKWVCRRHSPPPLVTTNPVASGVLGDIVANGVQWINAEVERDNFLETTKRGDVSIHLYEYRYF